MKTKLPPVLLLLFIYICQPSVGQAIKLNSTRQSHLNITRECLYLDDSLGLENIQQVLKQHFVKTNNDLLIIPYSTRPQWLKFDINNLTEKEDWVFVWDNALVEHITLYTLDSIGNVLREQSRWPYNEKNEAVFKGYEPDFKVKIPLNKTTHFLLKVETPRGHVSSLHLYDSEHFRTFELKDLNFRGVVSGMMIFRLALILVLTLFILRDRKIIAYSIVIIGRTVGYWALLTILGPLLTDDPINVQKINHVGYSLGPIAAGIFMLLILPLKRLPTLLKALIIIPLVLSLFQLFYVTGHFTPAQMKLTVYLIVTSSVSTYIVFAYCIFKRINIYPFYSVPFLFGNFSYFLMNVRLLNILHFPGIFALAMFFFLGEFMLFILFLGQIFRSTEIGKVKAEEKLKLEKKQKEKLKELDQLKTDFFTTISHELRTPLTLIAGPVVELKQRYPKENLLDILKGNVTKLQNLINEILDIQKLEAGKSKPKIIRADFGQFLKRIVGSFESHAIDKGLNLGLELSHHSFDAYFDPSGIEKIINNLISNAFKFTSEGGSILVKVLLNKTNETLRIEVIDSGKGIGAKHLPHIFDRFYRSSDNANDIAGSGIGLSLVKELVNLYKGSVRVQSSVGKGTTFILSFPIDYETWKNSIVSEKEQDAEPEAEPVNLQDEPFISKIEQSTILIIDDNADMRSYLKELLQEKYQIKEAANGKEGLELAKLEVPDVIITDLMMPLMHGTDFSIQIRKDPVTSHIPIIMLTARADKKVRLENLSLGIDHFLTKPFDADELKVILKACIENRERLRNIFNSRDGEPLKNESLEIENDFIINMNQYLSHHFGNPGLKVGEIAGQQHMSETQFRRKLKYLTGNSPNEYIRKFRLNEAAKLLAQGTKSVSEVAYEVGFENLSYFSKIFQSEYGVVPSEYTERE